MHTASKHTNHPDTRGWIQGIELQDHTARLTIRLSCMQFMVAEVPAQALARAQLGRGSPVAITDRGELIHLAPQHTRRGDQGIIGPAGVC